MNTRFFFLTFIILPLMLSAFSVESSVDLYRADQVIQENTQSIAIYQAYIYVAGSRGVGIYHQVDDSLCYTNEMKGHDFATWSVLVHDGKLFTMKCGSTQVDCRLFRYDLSDPANPVLEDSLAWRRCDICFLDGGYLFVHEYCTDSPNLLCHVLNPLDFSDELACYTIPHPYRSLVHAGDGYCVIQESSGNEYTTSVFDISDPTNIHEIYTLPVGSIYAGWQAILMSNGTNEYLLYTAYGQYAAFYNITDHDNPAQLWMREDYALNVVMQESVAHILFRNGMVGLDISDPSQPVELYDQPLRKTWDNEAAEGYIVTAGANLTVHQFTGGNLEQVAQAPLDGTLDYTACDGKFLYLGTYYQSLVQLDVRNPVPPVPTRRLMPEPTAYSGAFTSCADSTLAFQYYVYEGDTGHLATRIYRVAADGEMNEIAYVGEQAYGLPHLRGDSELFLGENDLLYRYSVSDDGIELEETLSIPAIGFCCTSHYGEYLYLSNDYRMLVVHAPNGGSMELTDDFDTEYVSMPCFVFIDHYMLFSGIFAGDQTSVYDLADPAHPTYAFGLSTAGPMGIDEENELLFIGIEACNVYDLSPLLESGDAPEFVSSFTSSDTYTGFYPLSGNRIICVDRTGVTAIEYSYTAVHDDTVRPAHLTLSAYPNPFNPETTVSFNLTQAGTVKLCAYNIRGQRVATLADDTYEAGEHIVQWNADGLPSGVYLLRMEAGGRTQTTKSLLLK